MKLVGILSILTILFFGIPGVKTNVIKTLAADANCRFINDENDAGKRNTHLNNYNVCVTADYMDRVIAKRPYPQTKVIDSMERRNLIEKLLRFNDENKIAYVTLLSDYGTVIATYTIQGKVSSNQSSLTTTSQVWRFGNEGGGPMASPTDDGSYGENEPGIFFFTTAGVLVQWNGKYLLTDAPQQVVSAPVVTYNVTDKPTNAGIDVQAR